MGILVSYIGLRLCAACAWERQVSTPRGSGGLCLTQPARGA
jgi:hypothetical protein